MNKLGKIAPIIVILASLGSLFFAFKLSSQKNSLKSENVTLASERERSEKERDAARTEAQTAKTALAKTTDDLNAATANLQAAQVSLTQKSQEAETFKMQVEEKSKELDQVSTELASTRQSLQEIQDKIGPGGDPGELSDRIAAQTEENKILGQQLTAMRDENKALKTRVAELSTSPINLRGRIAAVQDAWGFVVLDIGRSQQVTSNAQFLVYRDSKMVGKVQIVSVGDNTSVAQILPEYQRGSPRVGDFVLH
jgi:chromosome segregation ATPase